MLENNYFNLLLGVPDTDFAKIIECSLKTGLIFNKIYERINQCLDKKGLQKKQERFLDKKYFENQTDFLSVEFEDYDIEQCSEYLETGRPGITAEEVFIFICLRAYFDSVTSQESVERMVESQSLYIYYMNKNKKMPRPKTINENLNCIDIETLEFIHQCQLQEFLNEDLDDFNYAVFDSTSVEASSSWPTDAAVIYKLLTRIQIQSQKLENFKIANMGLWYTPYWLEKLSRLLFEINNTKGTSGNPKSEKI